MSTYTISPDFLKTIDKEEQNYFSNILFVFTNRTNTFKITKDRNSEIISIYKSIPQNADIIKIWLELMSYSQSPFEKVDIDVSNIKCIETKFVKICKETKGSNNLIVYSAQNLSKFNCTEKKIEFEGVNINILDRDDASAELNKKSGNITILNSQVATHGSQINKSTNE